MEGYLIQLLVSNLAERDGNPLLIFTEIMVLLGMF